MHTTQILHGNAGGADLKIVEWHGRRSPKLKDGVLVDGYCVSWDLTLECGHVVRVVAPAGAWPPSNLTCETCEHRDK